MKGIIGTIEADMNQNRGIFYLSPDYFESNSYFGRMIGKNLDAPEEALINSVWNLHVFEENRPKKLEACIALLHYFAQIKEEVNKPNTFCYVLTHGGNPLGVFKHWSQIEKAKNNFVSSSWRVFL